MRKEMIWAIKKINKIKVFKYCLCDCRQYLDFIALNRSMIDELGRIWKEAGVN
jgi:hypothetical protein